MRVLYVASAIDLGTTSGGATHVQEVACGLAGLGHELCVVARAPAGEPGAESLRLCGVQIVKLPAFVRKEVALLGLGTVRRAMNRFRPDAVMERFYNFAGAGVLLAHRRGLPVMLEVNAPMIDPPGTLKTRLDRLLLGMLRRWAVRQARWSRAIVTPLHTTVPPEVARSRIHELPWGANVERFDPSIRETRREEVAALRAELGLAERPVAVFLGSFREWHGAAHFAEAARRLISGGSALSFLAIGGGPELAHLMARVEGWGLPASRFVFSGPQPHDRVPLLLAMADVGVAPFDIASYAPLRTFGFYWSPLKVFEYMAMGLPVVTVDVQPLNEIVRNGREGLLYRSGDLDGLAGALSRLERNKDQRATMGRAARERVAEKYSWRAHCEALDRILRGMVA